MDNVPTNTAIKFTIINRQYMNINFEGYFPVRF